MAEMPDPTAPYRDFLAAIREALDLPWPDTDTDRALFEHIQRDRLRGVLGVLDSVLDGAGSPGTGAEVLRDRTRELPVTYRRYIAPAEDHPADCVVCAPGACCSPISGVHTSCPGPAAGTTVVSSR